LWLIFIFQGWEMGNVPIPGFYIYFPSPVTDQPVILEYHFTLTSYTLED